MKDILSSSGAFTPNKISALNGGAKDSNNTIWTTERINAILEKITNEGIDIKGLHNTPFRDNDINLKRGNLPFEYTPEEWEELRKCKDDVSYFISNYCKIQTNDGLFLIKDLGGLRDFQDEIIVSFDNNNKNVLMASRQTGKTVTSALFILWFLLFQLDKTALVVADNFTTTRELLDKFRITLDNLPFFMKPGILHINTGNIKFDNGSRIVGRTTTKKSGIGLTVNLLYIDEFAHIDGAKLDEFYRAVFPTVTADPNSKIIITSTPNGRNKFYDIWTDALSGKSSYIPLRVDWWQVAGHDEEWKLQTIADLGSIEDFNQEYGLQFFSSDELLLNSTELGKLLNIKTHFINAQFPLSEDWEHINQYFTLHKKYATKTLDEIKADNSNYVFSIDTADGDGGDYSTLTIYKVVALPIGELLKKKEAIRKEIDTISLIEIGVFRSNELDLNQFAACCEFITYKIFNPEKIRVLLEMNHKGEIIHTLMAQNSKYWSGQFFHTKHTEMATHLKLGVRLGPTNKTKYCLRFKHLVSTNKIIPNSFVTVMEFMSFGKKKGGTYRSQYGNDDLAMTSVNLSAVFGTSQFWDIAIETYENTSSLYRKEIEEKIFNVYLDPGSRSLYNYDELKNLNNKASRDISNKVGGSVFDSETYEQMQKIKNKFFKS